MLTSIKKAKIVEFLLDINTFATVLLAIVVDNYGTECLSYDPATLEMDLKEDFHIDIPRINIDKLHSIITAVTTDVIYRDWITFNATCNAFNNEPVDFQGLDIATPEQIAWTVTELYLNEDKKDKPEFNEEVKVFVGSVLAEAGITKPVDVLNMAIMPDVQAEADDISQSDPEMYEGMFNKQNSDNQYIQDYIKANIHQLITQISECPLEHRDQEGWSKWAEKATKALS